MECQVQITVKVANRLKKKLGVGGMVDIQKLTRPLSDEDLLEVKIKVYHKNYQKIVTDFFGDTAVLNWTHNGKKIT